VHLFTENVDNLGGLKQVITGFYVLNSVYLS